MKVEPSGTAVPREQPASRHGTLTRLSLRDQATDTLRAQIMSGELVPNELYSITDLANSLGVSPTPVREALLRLSTEGLGHFIANRGFSVAWVDLNDLKQIVACRQLLEPPAMAQIAQLPDVDLDDFYSRAHEITQLARNGDVTTFLLEDRDFHLDLIALTGNDRLVSMVAILRAQTRLYGIHRTAGSENLIKSAEEHVRLLDLIAAHDSDGVTAATSAHLGHVFGVWSGIDETSAGA